jgi:hypothetical protein
MNKKMVFGLILILGIGIGYLGAKRNVDIFGSKSSDLTYSFNKNKFKDPIEDINEYEEYRVLVDYSYVELEEMMYGIQKRKESEPFDSRILIHFYGNYMESTKIQEKVESKFGDLGISYVYTTYEATNQSVRLGILY